jgi:outer membrane protein assembly factor BamB
VLATLAIADGKVIVPTQACELLALSAANGQTVWSYRDARNGCAASPAVTGGAVLIGDKAGWFHSVNLATGQA